jgi:succinate dehydrogenase / fumarate reductase cytochrome b subunit
LLGAGSKLRQESTPVETASAPPAVPVSTGETAPSFLVRHQFLIYRLFSLSGLVPVGAYLVVHLLTNASIVNGPMTYQEQVDRIHSLGVALLPVEITFIFLPILFHAAVGWLIISGALPNTLAYPYASNIRYTMQRVTGIIAFAFIVFHVIQLHHLAGAPFKDLGGGQFDPEHASSSAAVAIRPLWITILYAIGMLATVYHFANGLWTQGITWGLWTSPAAQRRASWISGIVGVALAVIGLSAIGGMANVDVEQATRVENEMLKRRDAIRAIQDTRSENESQAERRRAVIETLKAVEGPWQTSE